MSAKQTNEQKEIASKLTKTKLFPLFLMQLISSSENDLEMTKTIQRISMFYGEEIEAAIDAFNAVTEPAIIFFAGIIVTAVLAALYLPMTGY
jgi:type IV pilus assembly protein PilC